MGTYQVGVFCVGRIIDLKLRKFRGGKKCTDHGRHASRRLEIFFECIGKL
jgi:hypothetical protein